MTCIAAIKQGNRLVMAADGRAVFQDDRIATDSLSKIITLDNSVMIGLAGHSTMCMAITTMLLGPGEDPTSVEARRQSLANADSDRAIRHTMRGILTAAYEEAKGFILPSADSLVVQLLVGNRYGLWEVYDDGVVVSAMGAILAPRQTVFAAVGSGTLAAKSATNVLLTNVKEIDISDVAAFSVNSAALLVSSCGRLREVKELTFKE